MPTQHSELKRWLFLNDDDYVCLVVNQSQKQRSRIRPQTIAGWNSHLKHSQSVSGSRRCQQGRSCLCSAPLVWPRASFVQTQLGSPAGEGGLDNITVTTRITCLGYFQNARGGRSTRKKMQPQQQRGLRANSVRNSLQVSAWKHGLCTKRPHA